MQPRLDGAGELVDARGRSLGAPWVSLDGDVTLWGNERLDVVGAPIVPPGKIPE